MKKLDLFDLHPNLRIRLNENNLGGFIADLLQTLHDQEEQLDHLRAQSIIDRERLRNEREQLERDRLALSEDKKRLLQFQSFIVKLADQIEELEPADIAEHFPLPRQGNAR